MSAIEMSFTEEKLRRFLREKKRIVDIDGDAPLFSNGTLDSVSQLELIMFLDTEAGVQVSPLDLDLENFDSVNRILRYVASRVGS